MRPRLRASPRRITRAARSAVSRNGMGKRLIAVIAVSTKPGQTTETRTPLAATWPRRASPHTLTAALLAQ